MAVEEQQKSGLRELIANLRALPANLISAIFRHGAPESTRTRSQTVFSNVFLHIHSVRTHRWSLRKWFTCGLGIASAALFLILTVTGLVLMVYYKPSATEAASVSASRLSVTQTSSPRAAK